MGDTWITNMSDFDYPDEEAYRLPKEAIRLAEYFGSIIEGTVARVPAKNNYSGIKCRRRPGRIPCTGIICSELHPNGTELQWWCPVSDDNGRISNWGGTRWDPKGKEIYDPIQFRKLLKIAEKKEVDDKSAVKDEYENIQGTIEWDDTFDGELPEIVTKGKVYNWIELGKELMTYEGFRISITIN
ncbi:hypothetical protein LCGC14_3049910 [marine sediment metagenome]|uniref:DUF7713 domain-containing protein n=1 Tax=marine sediment metagenome TaxID=412755 RepID=A0A0F8WM20_9ZZZZ